MKIHSIILNRAASTESDTAAEVPGDTRSKPSVGRGGVGLQRKGSLLRKTLSLEQTSNAQEQVFIYLVWFSKITISLVASKTSFFFWYRTFGRVKMKMEVSTAYRASMMTQD